MSEEVLTERSRELSPEQMEKLGVPFPKTGQSNALEKRCPQDPIATAGIASSSNALREHKSSCTKALFINDYPRLLDAFSSGGKTD